MGIFNEFFKKEKPVFTGLKFGFGSGGGPDGGHHHFSASGGTKTEWSFWWIFLSCIPHQLPKPVRFVVSSGCW